MFAAHDGRVWLGAAPARKGAGIQVAAEGLLSWEEGAPGKCYAWDELGELQVLVAESRTKFPRLLSWLGNLVLVTLALWAPSPPEEIHIGVGDSRVITDLRAAATETYGYTAEEINLAESRLRRLADDPASRSELVDADAFVSAMRKHSHD